MPWSLNGTDAFYTGGEVGIGTSTPVFNLHVEATRGAAIFAHNDGSTGLGDGLRATTDDPSGFAVWAIGNNGGIGIVASSDSDSGGEFFSSTGHGIVTGTGSATAFAAVFQDRTSHAADLVFGNDDSTILFPATVAPNVPMIHMFATGTGNADRMVISHSPTFPEWGLQYADVGDEFRFQSSNASEATLTVELAGNVGIGTESPVSKLQVIGDLTFRDTGGISTGKAEIRTAGDMEFNKNIDSSTNDGSWFRFYTDADTIETMRILSGDEAAIQGDGTFTSNGIDYAEAFKAAEPDLEPGDVVSLAVGDWESARRSPGAYDPHIIGVVSTKPAFVAGMSFDQQEAINPALTAQRDAARAAGNAELERQLTEQMMAQVQQAYRPIALAGRVPCKVDAQYGPIFAGDRITSSPTPGHAMLQSQPGQSIGIALEDFTAGAGTIIVLVQPGWHGGMDNGDPRAVMNNALVAPADNASLRARVESLEKLVQELLAQKGG